MALRLTIGWHFLYEGVWKIQNADEFSAAPFSSQAKGPFAPVFYAMLPDIDGTKRFAVVEKDGEKVVTAPGYEAAWNDMRERFLAAYSLDDKQKKEVDRIHKMYLTGLNKYLAQNRKEMLACFSGLEQLKRDMASKNEGTEFQRQRLWDRQQELRSKVATWGKAIDAMGESYHLRLLSLLSDEQRARGTIAGPVIPSDRLPVKLPFANSRSELLDFTVTYALTAIGLCLMLGCFTRLAALGGAGFLAFVVATQWPWPTVIPHAPPVVGHALLVDKNFVEMVAMLALAALPVGRWAGLDRFLYDYVCVPLRQRIGCCKPKAAKTEQAKKESPKG